jgi:hypothetical protein
MKQSAVEWLVEQINKNTWYDKSNYPQVNIGVIDFEQAKEMEKEQQDDFAIEFAEWLEDSIYKENNFIKMDVVKRIKYTTKELLEIYKKEKSL